MDPRTQLNDLRPTWRPPKELGFSRPRAVRLRAGGKALMALATSLWLGGIVTGLLLYVKATAEHEERQQLLDHGERVEAEVVRRWAGRGDNPRHWVEYVYPVDGQSYRGRIRLGRRSWDRIQVGSTLPIDFLPENPQLHMVIGHEATPMPLPIPFLIAGGLALPAWLITRQVASQRRLLAFGWPAAAIVTRLEQSQHGQVAHFTFLLLSGAGVDGKTGPQKNPPQAGSILCAIYEPDRERHHGIYPLTLVRLERE